MDDSATTTPEGKAALLTEQIIDRFGGIRPMAAKLDMPVTTVQGWKKRGVIPSVRHGDILAAAQREGIALDSGELAQTDPGGRAEARILDAGPERTTEPTSASRPRSGSGLSFIVALLALIVAVGSLAAGWRYYVQPVRARLAEVEARLAAAAPTGDLVRRLDVLESDIAQRPVAAAGPANTADAAGGDRLAAIEQQIAQIKAGTAQTEELSKRLSDMQVAAGGRELLTQAIRDIQSSTAATQGEVERLSTQLKTVDNRLDQVDAVLAQRRQQALRAEAVVLAVGQLRTALRDSKPFTKEVAALRALVGNDAELGGVLDGVQPLGDAGVSTADELRTQFGQLAPNIVRSSVVGDGASWWRQALYRIQSVVSIRRVGQAVPGDRTDAIVARAEAKLDEDDLQGAIDSLRGLTGLPAQVAASWIHDAEQRVAADAAEAELTRIAIDRVATGNQPPGNQPPGNQPPANQPSGAQSGPAPAPRTQ